VPDGADELVARIDDVEGVEPREDRRGDDDPPVQIKREHDGLDKGEHSGLLLGWRDLATGGACGKARSAAVEAGAASAGMGAARKGGIWKRPDPALPQISRRDCATGA